MKALFGTLLILGVVGCGAAAAGNVDSLEKPGGEITRHGQGEVVRIFLALNTRIALATVVGLPNLEEVNLEITPISDAGLMYLAELSQLHALYRPETRHTDTALVHLPSLTDLKTLGLSGTGITDAGLIHLEPRAAAPQATDGSGDTRSGKHSDHRRRARKPVSHAQADTPLTSKTLASPGTAWTN